jgi:cell division transport system permease protein
MVRTTDQRSGASQSKTRSKDRFKSYLNHHKIVAVESLLRLLRTPMQSLLTWLVVAIAIALPGILYLTITHIQTIGQSWQFEPQLSVYLNPRVREDAIHKMREQLLAMPEIAAVNYITPQQALTEFAQYSGLGNVLESLDENPLPPVLEVYPSLDFRTPQQLLELQTRIADDSVVDEVQLDITWVERLQKIMAIAERVVLTLAGLLAVGVLLVIGNTIRLAIESRRDEILIVKLVGGANSFVRRPFLYTGVGYGLGGGILAWLLLVVGVYWLSTPVAQLAGSYDSAMQLRGLGWAESLIILVGAAVLGLLGAALAVSRHLHLIEPT